MSDSCSRSAALPHPVELALLAVIAAALALRTLLAALLALVLAVAGWRPGANAPTRPIAEQMQPGSTTEGPLPRATLAPEAAGAEHHQPTAQPPAAEPITLPTPPALITTTAAALAHLPMAELRAACAAAGCRPGRSRASAVAALQALRPSPLKPG